MFHVWNFFLNKIQDNQVMYQQLSVNVLEKIQVQSSRSLFLRR